MPRSIDRDKLSQRAEKISKDAFMDPADMGSGRAKQTQRWGALRTLVGDAQATRMSPWLKYDAESEAGTPRKASEPVSGGKGRFQAKGGRVRKASGGRIKGCFSTY